jgi:predicted dehydrogenase
MHFLIIGAGSIGERHLRNFLRIKGVHCSVADTSLKILERIKSEYRVDAVYSDYRDARLESFDGVVICIPANLHITVARDIMGSGTNILLEKPLSMNTDGLDELKQLVMEGKGIFSVAFTLRSDPLYRELRDRIVSGEAGAVSMVNFYAGQYWPAMRKDFPPKYAQSRVTGGGAIPDHLIHMINYLEWCFGKPANVAARQWKLGLTDIETEDSGCVIIEFDKGPVAVLNICLFQQDNVMKLQVIGKETTLRLSSETDRLEIFDPAGNTWRCGDITRIDRDMVFLEQAKHFIDCIQGKAEPRCTLAEAEQTLKTMLAALQSGDSDSRLINTGKGLISGQPLQ